MENEHNTVKGSSKRSPEELFNKFIEAEDCPEILQSFQRLVHATGVKAETPREFYQNLKTKLQSWKCKSLWELLDNRANQKEYSKGTICEDVHALVIGCGPIGLRTAIELALLGAQVVILEKRQNFARNNVLHLWPFLLTDFRSLGAKKFYGKFCSGSIDHISIRRLQSILLKTALIFGVKVFTGVTFEKIIEPINEEEGWKCSVTPSNQSVSDFEIDVLIGADGKKNVLPGFAQIEMRGTLAIGVTANFVNYYSEEEARVEEISGIAYQFNPAFFQKLRQLKGISLENIVYYKDETHYFVMTAIKSSLLDRGVLKQDFGNNPQKLLSPDNVDRASLRSYVNDTVDYATKGLLKHRDLKKDKKGNADIAVFDFTSIKKAANSARIKERKGHKLLIGLVGDSLLEPFWPTGSGCARGVLSALDAAWMVRSFALDKPPLQILSERENIYRLLSGTSGQNLQKNFDLYTINPSSRYMHIPQKKIQEVYHLFDTDDPVNADFSLGSPTGILSTKGSKKKRVSLGTKQQRRTNRKHIKFAAQSSQDSQTFSPASSLEDIPAMSTEDRVRFAEPKPRPRSRTTSENLTSGGEEVHEITKETKLGKKSRKSRSPLSSSQQNQSKMKKSPFDAGLKKKSKRRKSDRASPPSGTAHEEKAHKRRSFFGFGRGKTKSRLGRKSPKTPDIPKENKAVNETITAEKAPRVQSANGGFTPLGEPDWNKDTASFSRNGPTRRSARDIIAEMEARNKNPENTTAREKKNSVDIPRRKVVSLPKLAHEEITRKSSVKRTTSEHDIRTPQSKHHKKEGLWEELSSLSPSAKEAVPALSRMSPEKQQENHRHESHDLASAMRMAGLMAMAAPLLIDEPTENSLKYSERSWFSRNNGHVKSAINKYDSLNGKKLLAKNSNDSLPLPAQFDMVDGSNNRSEKKPTLVEIAKRIAANQRYTSEEQQLDQPSSMDVDGASSWQPTAIAFVEGRTGMDEMESASNERASYHARQDHNEKYFHRLKEDFSSLDQESTDSPVKKNFSSPIYKKTFIASVHETPKSKDEHKQLETPRDYAKEAEWRKSPALAKKEMERLMVALTETMSKERAEASIRFLISMFRRIQRNPREDKFRRIFKSRVKFKKYVWTVRNAKMFMFASGWIEVGSFLIFSANKNVREPLAILNKHLELLASGASVQISAIKSTPKRDMNGRTPRSARALPFSLPSTPPKTPKTNNSTGVKTDLPASLSKSSSRNKQETPVRTSSSKHTPMEKRFSKSVPLNLDSEWDLEMEDPLLEESLSHSAVKRGRLTSSVVDVSDKKNSRGTITPTGRTPTRMQSTTPDVAIMEEIEGLSNTLDDLMESMVEDTSEDCHSNTNTKKKGPVVQEEPIKDLCTTLDYMLDSSEEEELDHDLNQWKTREGSVSELSSPASSTSAFSKVSFRSPSSKSTTTPEKFKNKNEISALSGNNLSSLEPSKNTVQETKKDSLGRSNKKKDDTRKTEASVPVSTSTTNDLKFIVQKKEKISLEKKEKKDSTPKKTGAPSRDTDNVDSAKETGQYSLRPRKTNSNSASNKNNDDTKKPNDSKKTSRRKLPNDPDRARRPRSVSDVQIQKAASSSLKSASNPPRKERPSSRNSVNSDKDVQPGIQSKDFDDNVISKTGKSDNIRKDKPFAFNKVKSKSTATLSDSTVEAKRTSSANMVSKNSSKLSSISKSKSEMNVSGKANNTTSSKTHGRQKSSSALNRKQSSSSETMSTTQKVEKAQNIPRNLKVRPESQKKVELDAEHEFKKPNVPKSRSRRPETSKSAGKLRESTGEESLSTSALDTNLKSRPPSGLERTRSARARKRKEITSRLDSLETSYETLEKSPNRTLNKKTSTSSTESNASSLTKKTSLTETVTEQQRFSLRKKAGVSRTSSAASRSSATSGEDVPDASRTRRSMSNDSLVKTRRRSSAKRTPSNASLERKKIDGLLTKEDQDLLRKRTKSASEKPIGSAASKDNLEKIRVLRSKAVDISQIRRADSSGSESIRRRSSFKAKHRKAATRSSSKSHEFEDDTQSSSSSNLNQDSKKSGEKRSAASNIEQKVRSADDSFDDITVVARNSEESAADGPVSNAGRASKKERNENDNLPFSLKRKLAADDKGVDTTDHISNNIEHQELGSKTSTQINHEQNGTKNPEKKVSESRDIQEESDSSSLTDDTKMEFRLRNTGSWMVLDYEGLKESPTMLKKISMSSENYLDDQSPRASISSIETPRENAEMMNDDEFVLRMQGSATEDEDETTFSHNKENGSLVSAREDKLESLVTNGSLVPEENGLVPAHGGNDVHDQNGYVKPYSNGKASNGKLPSSDPPGKEALKKKTKALNEKSKTRRMKSQSVENLTSDRNRVKFEEIQNLDVPRASTLNRSPKDTKKHTFPFALRKKKTSGSCSDLNGRSPEINVESLSPTKTKTGVKTAPHGLIMNPEDKSFSSPHDKSYEKKKLAPFKMFKKRKSKDTST